MSEQLQDQVRPFFVVAKPKDFRWTVKVPVPVANGYVYASFTGVFKHLEEDELNKLVGPESTLTDRQVCEAVLLAVEDVAGEDGNPLASSPELRDQVLGVQRAPRATVTTYIAAMRGMAAEKNS